MSPREIQARLRAGRTVEQVAAEADVAEEWVARFSPPIEAEQRQVVARAKSIALATARRGESAQPLGVSVRWNLVDKGLRLTEGEFDQCWSAAHMRDQEWIVVFRFTSRKRSQVAEWELDLRDGSLSPRNRLATELGFVEAGRRRRPAEPLPPPPSPAAESRKRSAAPSVTVVKAAATVKRSAAKKSTAKSTKKSVAKRTTAKKSTAKKSSAKKATAKKKAAGRRPVAKKAAARRSVARAAPSKATRSTKSLRSAKRAKSTKSPAGASRKTARQAARPAAKKTTKKKAAPPARRGPAAAVAPTPPPVSRPPVDELAQRRLELVGVRSAPLNPRPVRRPPPVEVRPSERQPRRPAPAPVPAAVEAPAPAAPATPSRDDSARAERAAQRAARRSLAERRAAAAGGAGAGASAGARVRPQSAPSEPGVVPGLDVVPAAARSAGDRVVTIRADRAAPPRTRGESDEGVTVANRAPLRPISPAARPNRRRFGRNR